MALSKIRMVICLALRTVPHERGYLAIANEYRPASHEELLCSD